MRRTTLVLAALVALAAFPALAQFDNYHYNASMNCSDCHSMHASAHENVLAGTGTAITDPNATVGAGTPPLKPWSDGTARTHLLKSDTLCESCHDGQTFAPDVVGANTNTYIRSAGGTVVSGETAGGHEIGNTNAAPGWNATSSGGWHPSGTALECVSCHSPHGGTAFRNLGPYNMKLALGGTGVTAYYPTVTKSGTWSNTTDVNINITGVRNWSVDPLEDYYARGVVSYTRLGTDVANPADGILASNRMDHFCGVCHGNFHGGADGDTATVGAGAATGAFKRHPTSRVQIATTALTGQRLQAFNNLKVYQATGTATSTTDSPGCLTCHKAHGNGNPFGLIYPSGTAVDTSEEGDGTTFKSLCKTCHGMGGTHPF